MWCGVVVHLRLESLAAAARCLSSLEGTAGRFNDGSTASIANSNSSSAAAADDDDEEDLLELANCSRALTSLAWASACSL